MMRQGVRTNFATCLDDVGRCPNRVPQPRVYMRGRFGPDPGEPNYCMVADCLTVTVSSVWSGATSGSVMQKVVPFPGAETSEIVHDIKAEPGTALRAPGGEKRIEDVMLNFLGDAGAII